ncbi:MIF domain-containing protein [Diaporthe helianthi]|uniref:L-dopachrome isomerase n=1 Tax=Diaporthe helianthi TaxID=158607 RepID=A0A2P5I1Y7_DIAHE|nr:MIF domain-containing protein [Diaporthe helianthi]
MPFTDRQALANRHPWTLPQLTEMDELMQPITRRPPGDAPKSTAMTMGRADLSRRKTHYYDEAFSGRCVADTLRERIQSDSVVLAELKTNVIVSDEFIFITELSTKIAERYHRPLSSIAVRVQHSACIFFAGTFEPAYTLTLSALAPYIQPSTNQRNAYLLSEHLEEALGVPQPRGLIRFVAMQDENVALNGKTLAQSLDEEANGNGSMGVIDEGQPATFARRKRLSVKSLSNIKASPLAGELTPPTSLEETTPVGENTKPERVKVARRRKSFVAGLFSRPGSRKENGKQIPDFPGA